MPLTLSSPDDSPTAARRKREIADAARAELIEKGVEGLRMRAIAE
ncbi:MAG: AcrR family transcriptional regulator, partial [Halocynthiibacter sp.]